MRVLLIQMLACSAESPRPRFNQGLGVLSAVLSREGHTLELAAFSRYRSGQLHEHICRFRPQAIYIDSDRFAADLSRHAVEFVGRHHDLPVIIGGMYPAAQPDDALSIPGVLAIVIAEPEVAVAAFLRALECGEEYEHTPGVWVNPPNGRAIRNEPANLSLNLDLLPPAERGLFNYRAHVAQRHWAEVCTSRGCPLSCAHCLNESLRELYPGRPWVRRRSPGSICDEIDLLCEQFPQIERIRFSDHAFSLDDDWLARFADVYAARCGLPFSCHLRAGHVRSAVVRLLASAGCDHAMVELVSGSEFIRNEIFDLNADRRQVERACRLLQRSGIRVTISHYIGCPYETEITVEQTLDLVQRLDPQQVQTRLFAPMPGTRAESICRESGWLAGLGEKSFRDNQPMIRLPAIPPRQVLDHFHQFNWQARHPRAAWLMRLLHRLPAGPKRSLYDVLVKSPAPNGRLLPADPRAIEVMESDGLLAP